MEKSFYEKKNEERIGLSEREELFTVKKNRSSWLIVRKRRVGYEKINREEIYLSKKKIFFRKSKRREDGFSKKESGLSENEEFVCKEN